MTKTKFLKDLEAKLETLPHVEVKKSIAFYDEMIDDRIEEGMSEKKAVDSLGSVDEIADKILYDTPLPTLIKSRFQWQKSPANITLLIVGAPLWIPLLIAFIAIIFSIYVVIWSLIIVLYAVVFSFAVGGLYGLIVCLFHLNNPAGSAFLLGADLILIALAIFAAPLAVWCSKWLIKVTAQVPRKTKSMFVKKEEK
jgi:uncharacterized membrane protein